MNGASLRERFDRDGYAVVAAALDDPTVGGALAHLDRLRATLPLPEGAPIVAVALGEQFIAGLVADERLVAIASALLGGAVVPFGATYLSKPPRSGLPASWHQDAGPWAARLGGAAAVTTWICLDGADAGNGCLRVIPGSHGLEAAPLRAEAAATSLFATGMDRALVDESRAVDLPLAPGDLVAHHPNLIHGSWPNGSDRPRTALAVRYRSA